MGSQLPAPLFRFSFLWHSTTYSGSPSLNLDVFVFLNVNVIICDVPGSALRDPGVLITSGLMSLHSRFITSDIRNNPKIVNIRIVAVCRPSRSLTSIALDLSISSTIVMNIGNFLFFPDPNCFLILCIISSSAIVGFHSSLASFVARINAAKYALNESAEVMANFPAFAPLMTFRSVFHCNQSAILAVICSLSCRLVPNFTYVSCPNSLQKLHQFFTPVAVDFRVFDAYPYL